MIVENQKGDPAAAVERYRQVAAEPWRSQGLARVALMEAKALVILTPRAFRSGETPRLKITTRNLEKLTFTAYKLSAEAYFRKKHALGNVEALDIGLVAPDAEWVVEVPGYAKYKPVALDYELKPVPVPGVYVVKVTDEKSLQATTLVLGSDVDAIVKSSREQLLVFAQDMKTGRGRPNARVLVAEGGEVVAEEKTGADGVLLKTWDKPRTGGSALSVLVLDGADVAGSGVFVPQAVSTGLSARAYIYADRTAYRPGQSVGLKGVIREVENGRYANPKGVAYKLEVVDSRGRPFVAREVTLSDFGTFAATVVLDIDAPLGAYKVRVYRPGHAEFNGEFAVQAYQLEKVDASFDLPRVVYFRGETIKGAVVARYQYGTPLANRPVEVDLPDGRTLRGDTDAAGRFSFELETAGFGEEQALRLVARLPQENVQAAATLSLAVRAFAAELSTPRTVYLDGETIRVDAATRDPMGKPVAETLSLAILKQVVDGDRVAEREVKRLDLKTDKDSGKGTASAAIDDADGGAYVLRLSGTDRFGNPVVAERSLTISGKKDASKLRILADRTAYKVGERAAVRLFARDGAGPALVSWEADRILSYKIIDIKEGDNALAWDVTGAEFPNASLAAARMVGTRFDEARLDLEIERDLRVTVRPTKATVGPGEAVEVEVSTTDQNGQPVAAEVSLAMVDNALLRLLPDLAPPIGPFFHGQRRTGAFAGTSTNTFRYEPASIPVPTAVVDEAERQLLADRDDAEKDKLMLSFAARSMPRVTTFNGALAEPAAAPAPMPGVDIATDSAPKPDAAEPMRGRAVRRELAAGGMGGDRVFGKAKGLGRPANANMAQLGAQDMKMREFVPEPATRQQFAETAYWNPAIVTGPDGRATVKFDAPSALSEYRLTARGVTGAETLAGQSTAEVAVRKPFFVELRVPASLTEGDRPRLAGKVHHVGVVGKVELVLTAYNGERDQILRRTIDVKGDGVDEVTFDAIEVGDGRELRVSLSARAGALADKVDREVPVRPWGVQAYASASGTSADDATAFVGLPPGREYRDAEMLIAVAPSVKRLLVELALGRDAYPLLAKKDLARFCPIPADTTAERASDLLAVASALSYLRAVGGSAAPEAQRLADRARGLVAELTTRQNGDGGWPWVKGASDRATSARALWAIAAAGPLGLAENPAVAERGTAYLQQEFAKVDAGDLELRAAVLHALSTRRAAPFEAANALNRARQSLPDAAMAYLALTFAELDRASLAAEVLEILASHARSEPTAPGKPPRRYWAGDGPSPSYRGSAEVTGLAALAFARARPSAEVLPGAIDWLNAHRQGTGWSPTGARGPALAALSTYYGRSKGAEDRYRLVVAVNDLEVYRADVSGPAEGKVVRVPARVLKLGTPNRVTFDIEGRGTYGYTATLTGFTRDFAPEQSAQGRPFLITQRTILAADPELDGRPLPSRFGVAVNAAYFENWITMAPRGGRARVRLDLAWSDGGNRPAWERDFTVLTDYLPAGASVVEGSVQSAASRVEQADGAIRFYFAPDQLSRHVYYDIVGTAEGDYRSLPPELASAYDPARRHLGQPGKLKVLPAGERSTDPYKPTPDELYARGKTLFDAGRGAEAAAPLESLWSAYTVRDEVAKDAARMLLAIHIVDYEPAKVVRYFEVLKEKAPEMVIPFDQIRVVGRAYADIKEYERAYLVWRATAEASTLEDARVGEVLRQRGKTLEAVAFLLGLWREGPSTPSIEADFFAVIQLLAHMAGRAPGDAPLRRELAAAELSRPELLAQSIRLTQVFLTLDPRGPLADEASLSMVNDFLDLEDYKSVVALAGRFAAIYPRSSFLDAFQYAEALGRFHEAEYDRAVEVAGKIVAAKYKDASGVDQPSPNKWEAIYILGQINDARRRPAQALEFYKQVADRYADAADAVRGLTRRSMSLPEVSVARPAAGAKPSVSLAYRNVAEVDVKVYPVDLMRLYLTRRSLAGVAGIDLAGITPLLEQTIKLGDGADYEDKARPIELPLDKEGAYLVMARGGNLYASGIVLISPLELEVLEEPGGGRVRATVRDATSKDYQPKVQVKVIGTENPAFLGGESDLRGVVVAEGVRGVVTAVARRGTSQYAFYRGTARVGPPPTPTAPPSPKAPAGAPQAADAPSLDGNLRMQNSMNQSRNIDRLKTRYGNAAPQGVQVEGVK